MRRRSAILGIAAATALIADGFWVYKRYFSLNATITYIGLDSVVMQVPASVKAPQLRGGRWDGDPLQALQFKFYDSPPGQKEKPMALVSLGPHPRYSQAVAVIRNLKARHVCHVLIRESGKVTPIKLDFGRGPEASLDIPAIVLCGSGYGDAGFYGRLPADRSIHVSVEDGTMVANHPMVNFAHSSSPRP